MEDFGKRLKEERERLGLTQEKFGLACGVGKTAQYLYERGQRHPASVYLDAAEKLGVDVHYVFTGTRKGKDWGYARAFSRMLYTTEWLMGLQEGRLEALSKELVELDEKADWFNEKPDSRPASADYSGWIEHFRNWLGTASKLDYCLDTTLLAKLLDAVAAAADKAGAALSTEKRLRAALMLYRDAKQTGEIDPQRVGDVVRLAT